MKRRMLFFGDSNTYGFDPRDPWGGRYELHKIWTTRLQEAHPEWEIIPRGQNGREIPHTKLQFDFLDHDLTGQAPLDLFAVMLGTNDLFCMVAPTAKKIAARMREMLWFVKDHPAVSAETKLLLIAPANIALGVAFGREIEEAAMDLSGALRALAPHLGAAFADAWAWNIGLAADGVHFSEAGHRQFYEEIRRVVEDLFPEKEEV